MIITNAILGLLSFEKLSGYDIKKKIQEYSYLPWSGNNNQVYKALSELLDKGLVVNESITQLNAPVKKVYSITEQGRNHLKIYAKTEFIPMQLSKPFLLRLLAARDLTKNEILALVEVYRQQLQVDINKLLVKDIKNSSIENVEDLILKHIYISEVSSLELELSWLETLESDLNLIDFSREKSNEDTQDKYKKLCFEIKDNILLYNVEINGTLNKCTEKNIKDIIIDVVENNCSELIIESNVFSNLNREFIEIMDFEFSKYNINFEVR